MEFETIFDLSVLEKAREANTVQNTRSLLKDFIDYMYRQPFQDDAILGFSRLRQLKEETIREHHGFMIPEEFTNNNIPNPWKELRFGIVVNSFCVYSGRFCFPVYEPHIDRNLALPMGLVGYDKFDDMKYRDSRTYGYKAKVNSVWGMERLYEYYLSPKPVFMPEGIMCAQWLRENDFHAMSFLGSSASPYVKTMLSRIPNVVWVPDADDAGFRFQSYNQNQTIYRPPMHIGKDLDDARKVNPEKLIRDLKQYESRLYVC